METNFVYTYYDQNILNDSRTFSVGVFLETQITNYLKVRVAGGYQKIISIAAAASTISTI